MQAKVERDTFPCVRLIDLQDVITSNLVVYVNRLQIWLAQQKYPTLSKLKSVLIEGLAEYSDPCISAKLQTRKSQQ